ncbi:hypothetical protein [Leeuwenhoekiella sp. H156]|uniref:hypothetical protein n=1 Tax=Leeuwenhoekiella sp. H156 TaxID=3450128 RepID=UPI003FA462D9
MAWYFWIIIFVIVFIIISYLSYTAKEKRLMKKYKDENLVEKLMQRTYWQGQTMGQLKDSLGKPSDVQRQVLKTKTKETWKYHKTGNNRYDLKIHLENGFVTGWDEK